MKHKLTKAEILWTRKCPLTCSYCAMIDYDFPQAPILKMLQGVDRLKALGCGFFAIYGASPLYSGEFNNLPAFIQHAENSGILTTVIVDGIDKATKEKLTLLHKHGLRSLTCSWDGMPIAPARAGILPVHVDKQTRHKSQIGVDLVGWFASEFEGHVRDVELVATVTKKNWDHILIRLPELLKRGIWFSFDFIHPDRDQPGSKAKGDGWGLVFEDNFTGQRNVRDFAAGLLALKSMYGHVHQSSEYLRALLDDPGIVTCMKWKCTGETFPSWVTIDADGTVLPCDDFWTERNFKVWDFDEQALEDFSALYELEIMTACPGCAWSTHWDAVRIAESGEGFDQYVHLPKTQP